MKQHLDETSKMFYMWSRLEKQKQDRIEEEKKLPSVEDMFRPVNGTYASITEAERAFKPHYEKYKKHLIGDFQEFCFWIPRSWYIFNGDSVTVCVP